MNIMWIPLPVSHSPAPSSRLSLPMRPMNRAHQPPATSSRDASSTQRVTFCARTGSGIAARTRPRNLDVQVQDDEDDRRAEDDDEQRREDAADQREQHLDRRL